MLVSVKTIGQMPKSPNVMLAAGLLVVCGQEERPTLKEERCAVGIPCASGGPGSCWDPMIAPSR